MNNPATLQAVLSRFMPAYQCSHALNPVQAKACHHIAQCRTEALGGQTVHCNQCEFEQIRYHSCRNRHCPQCQQQASAQWCDKQREQVLPAPYFHLVFTLPHELNPWVQLHPEVIYSLLFKTAWKTLKCFGADQKRLNGELGMTAVLHTWGQSLSQHVHLHCLVPGGALASDEWRPAKGHYLFPVRALSNYFRGAMVSAIRKAYEKGELSRITMAQQVDERLGVLMKKSWVVYTKSYLTQADTVVKYLAQYSHKIAISNHRLQRITDEQVTFSWKDYRKQSKRQSMSLSGEEFIRRFLLHVLPKGLMRIRHYGFLSNRCRKEKLAKIREYLMQAHEAALNHRTEQKTAKPITIPHCPCPKCKAGQLQVIAEIPAIRRLNGKRRQYVS